MLFIVVVWMYSDAGYHIHPLSGSLKYADEPAFLNCCRFDMDLITISGSSVGFPDGTGAIHLFNFHLPLRAGLLLVNWCGRFNQNKEAASNGPASLPAASTKFSTVQEQRWRPSDGYRDGSVDSAPMFNCFCDQCNQVATCSLFHVLGSFNFCRTNQNWIMKNRYYFIGKKNPPGFFPFRHLLPEGTQTWFESSDELLSLLPAAG